MGRIGCHVDAAAQITGICESPAGRIPVVQGGRHLGIIARTYRRKALFRPRFRLNGTPTTTLSSTPQDLRQVTLDIYAFSWPQCGPH
jgi:hypothetical protein